MVYSQLLQAALCLGYGFLTAWQWADGFGLVHTAATQQASTAVHACCRKCLRMDTLTSSLLANSQLPQELQQGRLAPFLELGCIPQVAKGNAQAGQDNREEAGWQPYASSLLALWLPKGCSTPSAARSCPRACHVRPPVMQCFSQASALRWRRWRRRQWWSRAAPPCDRAH